MNEEFDRIKLDAEQVSGYLERLQVDKKTPSAAYLSDLIYSHQINIPFEDLDIFKSHVPSLDIDDLYSKIVERERGGYCFELNSLFCALLNSLGFDAWPCMCKVSLGTDGKHMISHRATIVSLEEDLYYCDVGFGGPMPKGALIIKNGLTQNIENDSFTPVNNNNGWWQLRHIRHDGSEVCELLFQTIPVDDLDFIPLNQYMAESENNSIFNSILMANIATYDGYVSLTNICLKICRNGNIETTTIKEKSELDQVLKDYFCLEVDTTDIAYRLGLVSAESV